MTMGHETLDEFLASLPTAFDTHGGYDDTVLTKIMREELALAVTRGVLPPGTKVSVRKNHYQSITVDITEWSGAVFVDAYLEHLLDPTVVWDADKRREEMLYRANHDWRRVGRPEYVEALNDAVRAAERIANRHNYDNSRIEVDYFDVGYYLDVSANTVVGNARAGIMLESDPAHARMVEEAREAARTLGAACVKSYCGRRGIEGASKWNLESLIKLARLANGRPVVYDKRRRTWIPTDPDPNTPTPPAPTKKPRKASAKRTAIPTIKTDHDASECDGTCEEHARTVDRECDGLACGDPTCGNHEPKPPVLSPSNCRPLAPFPAKDREYDALKQALAPRPVCLHNRTMDGGRMYIEPTSFCRDCGASRKHSATTWSDGVAA